MTSQWVVVGVDPSATGTGLAALSLDGGLVSSACLNRIKGTGVDRLVAVQEAFSSWLNLIRARPIHFVMENYGFGIRESQPHKLGEIGGAIKLVLAARYPSPIRYPTLPAGSQVKKYCLGKGTGAKSEMLKGVYKKWGADLKTDDEADAYTLAQIGLGLFNGAELQYEKDVLQALLSPPKKNKAAPDRRPLVWAELPDEERYVYVNPAEYLRTL
jgi:Holliday junction resolvasome RuvABC endonuclease subunit